MFPLRSYWARLAYNGDTYTWVTLMRSITYLYDTEPILERCAAEYKCAYICTSKSYVPSVSFLALWSRRSAGACSNRKTSDRGISKKRLRLLISGLLHTFLAKGQKREPDSAPDIAPYHTEVISSWKPIVKTTYLDGSVLIQEAITCAREYPMPHLRRCSCFLCYPRALVGGYKCR